MTPQHQDPASFISASSQHKKANLFLLRLFCAGYTVFILLKPCSYLDPSLFSFLFFQSFYLYSRARETPSLPCHTQRSTTGFVGIEEKVQHKPSLKMPDLDSLFRINQEPGWWKREQDPQPKKPGSSPGCTGQFQLSQFIVSTGDSPQRHYPA